MKIWFAILLLLAQGAMAATTWYAAPAALGSGDGSSPANAKEFQNALNTIGNNNTIILVDGVYATTTRYLSQTYSGLTIQAQNRWKAVITGYNTNADYGLQVYLKDSHTIDGISVTNCTNSGIKITGAFTTVRNCYVARNGKLNEDGNGVEANTSSHNTTVENCLIESNGNGGGFGHGIYYAGNSNIVRNCVVRNNRGFGIHLYITTGSFPMDANHIYNNLTYGQTSQMGVVIYGADFGNNSSTRGTNFLYCNTFMDGVELDWGGAYITNCIVRAGNNFPSDPIHPSGTRPPIYTAQGYILTDQTEGGTGTVVTTYDATWFNNTSGALYWLGTSSPARGMALNSVRPATNFFGTAISSISDVGFVQYDGQLAADFRDLTGTLADFWLYPPPGGGGGGGGSGPNTVTTAITATQVRIGP